MKKSILFLLAIIFYAGNSYGAEITNKSIGGLIDVLGGPTTSILFGGGSGQAPVWTSANDSHNHTASTISGLGVTDFSSSNISQWTNDAGYVTAAGSETDPVFTAWNKTTGISITESQISDLGSYLTGNQTITLSGDATGSGTTAITVAVADDSHNHTAGSLSGVDNYVSWTAKDGDTTTYTITSGDTLQIAEGTYIDSNFTADDVLTISHADTSSQGSSDNSGRTYIQDISLDSVGHITSITTATETVTDTLRGIDDSPVNGQTSESITSNWAYDHANGSNPHSITKATVGLGSVVDGADITSVVAGTGINVSGGTSGAATVSSTLGSTVDIAEASFTDQTLSTASTPRFAMVGIGVTSPASDLEIRQGGNDYEDGLYIFDGVNTGWHILEGANDELLYACDTSLLYIFDKLGNFGVGALPNGTSKLTVGGFTGTASYSYVKYDTASGSFYYATSTERNKEDITELEPEWLKLLAITPVSFTDKTSGLTEPGLLAEDLDNAGLDNLVLYDEESRPNGVKYELVSLYLLSAVRNLVWPQLSAEEKQTVIQTARGIWKRQWRRDNITEVEIPEALAFEVIEVSKKHVTKEVLETEARRDVTEVDLLGKTVTKRRIKKKYTRNGDRYYKNLSTGERVKYRIKDGRKEAYKEPVYPVITIQEKKLKKNVRIDPDSGLFYRKTIPSKEDAENAAVANFEKEKPIWLKSLLSS